MLDAHKKFSGKHGTQHTEGIFSEGLWQGVTIVEEASGCINRYTRGLWLNLQNWTFTMKLQGVETELECGDVVLFWRIQQMLKVDRPKISQSRHLDTGSQTIMLGDRQCVASASDE